MKTVDELMRLHDAASDAMSEYEHAFNVDSDDIAIRRVRHESAIAALRSALQEVVGEVQELRAQVARLAEDRARFPDRPDDIGKMIGAQFGNLRAAAKSNEEAWHAARVRADIAERDTARIDHLQATGSTIDLLNGKPETGWLFMVGGLKASASTSLRSAIDVSMSMRKESP